MMTSVVVLLWAARSRFISEMAERERDQPRGRGERAPTSENTWASEYCILSMSPAAGTTSRKTAHRPSRDGIRRRTSAPKRPLCSGSTMRYRPSPTR